jgi:hypothetical protein
MSLHIYLMDDCTIHVPPGFRDRTSHQLEWKTREGDTIALVIQREPPSVGAAEAPAIDLPRYVAAQTRDYPARFAGFHLERDETRDHDSGFPMCRKAFRWRKDQDVLYHHQAFVLVGDTIVILTAAAKAAHREPVDTLLDDALQSFAARGS